MPSPKRGPRLGAGPAHQKLMLANLASDLFRHGEVKTTETKAKTLRPYAEKLITKAKGGDVAARRQVLAKLRDRNVVAYLFEEVAPRFADRPGGYTRILKLEPRAGDNAPMALIQLVERGARSGDEAIEVEKQRRSRGLFGRRRKRSGDVSVGEGAAGAATIADAIEEEPEELLDETVETTPGEGEGIEAQATPEDEPGPAQEPSAPDDVTAGNPPEDAVGGDADAGGGTGKDAGRS